MKLPDKLIDVEPQREYSNVKQEDVVTYIRIDYSEDDFEEIEEPIYKQQRKKKVIYPEE